MTLETDLIVSSFPDNPSNNFIKSIYKLNQQNTPEVGSLSSEEELKSLIKMSSCCLYVSSQTIIVGFIICLREGSKYTSKNYNFFTKKFSKFLYIDRIAIESSYRRTGIGKKIYSEIELIANLNKIPMCCEVNTLPLNKVSINFHKNFGFDEIGQRTFKNHSVAYFMKNYK